MASAVALPLGGHSSDWGLFGAQEHRQPVRCQTCPLTPFKGFQPLQHWSVKDIHDPHGERAFGLSLGGPRKYKTELNFFCVVFLSFSKASLLKKKEITSCL